MKYLLIIWALGAGYSDSGHITVTEIASEKICKSVLAEIVNPDTWTVDIPNQFLRNTFVTGKCVPLQ